MLHPALSRALLPLLCACSAAPSVGALSASPAALGALVRQADDGARIRFGDPEELAPSAPLFPGATYDESVPTPDSLLGQRHGTRLSHHAEILACFRAYAAASERVSLRTIGRTHEGRELVLAVVTSPANQARLDELQANLAALADPRGRTAAERERLLDDAVPAAWMGYSIHGDELSGSDAAVALGYHLAASQDAEVTELLDALIVLIDPCMNPDGRERIVGMVEQSAGYTPNLDYASMHRGRWPWGRGNHYLFDMNRDWMAGTQPETRARWKAVLEWNPQLFVDAHEMGSLDTYLFYPQAEPLNPHLQARHVEWQSRFAAGIASAFDEHGWGYYTREWADGWAPFYSDSWGSLIGAVGILYEQARTSGFPLRRESGRLLTYRESVHHQVAASLANLRTLAAARAELLESYADYKERACAFDAPGNDRMLVVRTGANASRERALLACLLGQGIEVFRTTEAFTGRGCEGALGQQEAEQRFESGALVVHARQPLGPLVRAFLELDTRLDAEALESERAELERKGESKVYDVTAWSLPQALGLDAWWCAAEAAPMERVRAVPAVAGELVPAPEEGRPTFAWIVDGADDAAVRFAARAMERGLAVHMADEAFSAAGRAFARGSLLVRRHENEGDEASIAARVLAAARDAGVRAFAATTGRSADEGPDLGGGRFGLLARPRVAVLSNAPVREDLYGHLWHELDRVIGVPYTILDAQALGWADLRRYNVLVLPPGDLRGVLEPRKAELETWVEGGGTLIACADAAVALTREQLGLSSVVRRRDVLDELEPFRVVAERERAARTIEIDERLVWEGAPSAEVEPAAEADEAETPDEDDSELAEERDAWRRLFSPAGVHLLAEARDDHWLTAGCDERLPVYFEGSSVLLSDAMGATIVRLAPAERLRLSGLLWPEARARIADSAYLTRERRGAGQVLLFASLPGFRGYERSTARLFANAVVYGPGRGASQPVGW